jgi:hypothetical protein
MVLVGVVIAYLQRDSTDRVFQSHFQFQITTFWIGLLYFFVGLFTSHFGIGVVILLCWLVWTIIRCVKGLLALNMGEAIRSPSSWWLGEAQQSPGRRGRSQRKRSSRRTYRPCQLRGSMGAGGVPRASIASPARRHRSSR